MAFTSIFSPGRMLILLANIFCTAGSFAADFNATHVYNPRWPPHAKFHNGQTMSLAVLLSLTSTAFLYKSAVVARKELREEYLFWASVVGSLYFVAGLCAILFPGTAWADPEFYVEGQVTQKPIFGGTLAAVWIGYGVEIWKARSGEGSARAKQA